jgi:hypothetical protein
MLTSMCIHVQGFLNDTDEGELQTELLFATDIFQMRPLDLLVNLMVMLHRMTIKGVTREQIVGFVEGAVKGEVELDGREHLADIGTFVVVNLPVVSFPCPIFLCCGSASGGVL